MPRTSWVWSLVTGISALGRLKQASHCEFEATMDYVVSIPEHPGVQSETVLKNKNQNKKNQNCNSLHINQSSPGKNGGDYRCLSPGSVVYEFYRLWQFTKKIWIHLLIGKTGTMSCSIGFLVTGRFF